MGGIRVAIVDDDKIVRRALSVFLQTADDLEIVGEAVDGLDGLDLVSRTTPDVVLLDMQMPRMGGVEVAKEIAQRHPETRVLAITTFGTTEAILPMISAGASGYLLKDAEPEEIVEAVRLVHVGAAALSPAVTARLIETIQGSPPPRREDLAPAQHLSDREMEVLEQLARGLSNAEIAKAIHISESTVKTHMSNITTKWNVRDRVQILIYAARRGLVSFR